MRYSIIPDSFSNSSNYGLNADLLIFQLWKIRKILAYNQIDTIFISLGYHTFKENYQQSISEESDLIDKYLERYILLENDKFYSAPMKKFVKALFKQSQIPSNNISYFGSFVSIDSTVRDSAKSAIHRHFSGPCVYNTDILKQITQIRDVCNENNVICIFLFPPTTKAYLNAIPEHYKRKVDSILLAFTYPNLIPPPLYYRDSFFFDGDHLNKRGASAYSNYIKNHLEKKHQNPY
jgi:hypothetical protein